MQVLSLSSSPVEGVPVIPNGSRLWGHLGLMREPDFRVALDSFSVQHADSEGRCTFYMGPTTPALSVTAASDVQLLLKSSVERNIFPLMQPHLDRFFGARNIGLLRGKEWKRQRAVVVQALHGRAFQRHNREAVRKATETFIQQLFLLHKTGAGDDEIKIDDMGRILRSLTMDIFGQSALHTDFGCCRHQLQPSRVMQAFDFMASDMMRRVGKDIWNPASHIYSLPTAANRRHAAERAYLRNFIADLVQQRRHLIMQQNSAAAAAAAATAVPHDLLTGLLEATIDQEEDDTTLSDMLVSLLFAGYETTSVAMTYTLYVLSQHPAVEATCLREIQQRAAASSDNNIDSDDLPYLRAVITETLRLYPPAISTTRSLEREITLPSDDSNNGVVVVPRGTYLYFPIWTIQRDPRNFEDPLEFRPERWVARQQDSDNDKDERWCERVDNESVRARAALVAFLAGARSCAGQRFALQEMSIVLSMLLERFRFEILDDEYVLTPHRDGFVQSPKGGVPMKAIPRE